MVKGKLQNCLDFIRDESIIHRGVEICGMIGFDGKNYVAETFENRSPQPKSVFIINPLDYLNFQRKYSPIAVFHSHLQEDSSPSEFDKVNSENCCLPFLIYSIPEKKFGLFVPDNSEVNQKFVTKVRSAL